MHKKRVTSPSVGSLENQYRINDRREVEILGIRSVRIVQMYSMSEEFLADVIRLSPLKRCLTQADTPTNTEPAHVS